jgi:hypothetical protein
VRLETETAVTVLLPKNPIARESAAHYVDTLKSVYVRIAEGGGAMPLRTAVGA